MENLTERFVQIINKTIVISEKISDPAARAKVYTDLALAIAKTGCVMGTFSGKMNEEVPSKEDLETKPKTKKTKAVETEQVAQPESAQDWGDPDLAEKYKDELEFIDKMQASDAAMGTTYLVDILSQFSSGEIKSQDDVKPFNIEAAVTFVREQLALKYDWLKEAVDTNSKEVITSIIAGSYEGFVDINEQVNDENICVVCDILNQAFEAAAQ